jgi:hypothetical protein
VSGRMDTFRRAWKNLGGRYGFGGRPEIECPDCGQRRPLSQHNCPMCQFSKNPTTYVSRDGAKRVLSYKAPESVPIEIRIAQGLAGVFGLATVGIMWALVQELIAGHWWYMGLCLALLAIVSFLMMHVIKTLTKWSAMKLGEKP